MDNTYIYIAWQLDDLDHLENEAAKLDRPEDVRTLHQDLDRANKCVTDWALSVGGEIVHVAGGKGSVAIPSSHVGGLRAIAKTYTASTGGTLSIGIGARTSEAQAALARAISENGDRAVVYDPETTPVQKSELTHVLTVFPCCGTPDYGRLPLAKAEAPVVDSSNEKPTDILSRIRGAADQNQADEERTQMEDDQNQKSEAVRQKLKGILTKLKEQGPQLRALSERAPQVGEVVNDLIATLRQVAQMLPKGGEALQGGAGDGVDLKDLPPDQVKAGLKEETEDHGGPPQVAQEIVADHLTQDPHSYEPEDDDEDLGDDDEETVRAIIPRNEMLRWTSPRQVNQKSEGVEPWANEDPAYYDNLQPVVHPGQK